MPQKPQNSAISKLRDDIDELSSAIDTHKAILEDLLNRRGDARQRLNFYLDPMARLPLEIQSHIFLLVDEDSEDCLPKPAPGSPPMLFLSVCRLWRYIALSASKLWTQIQMEYLPRGSDYSALCKLWLERAGNLPLSLALCGSLNLEESVLDLLASYGLQLEHLALHVSLKGVRRPWELQIFEEPALSSVKTLFIEVADSDGAYYGNMAEWLQLLRAAPQLSRCIMSNTFYNYEPLPSQSLALPSLESLTLGKRGVPNMRGDAGSSSSTILLLLTLPALKTLTLSELDITDEEFFAFLSRSSPPLESLEMTLMYHLEELWLGPTVSECFRLIPTLTSLDLFALPGLATTDSFLPFIETLASPEVLPNLRDLKFHPPSPATIDYAGVLAMLTSRATSLERFELRFKEYVRTDYTRDLPAEGSEVRAGLRQLSRNGMIIHIGDRENLL
ncbi:F-box domain-containing protein [Favolaschia claudopus]|uniref:F-box domain-containing protein n=1 Tax=Favolaschia claudopus TaxID=2862362 RepID=A0AAW0B8R9_9AGAR